MGGVVKQSYQDRVTCDQWLIKEADDHDICDTTTTTTTTASIESSFEDSADSASSFSSAEDATSSSSSLNGPLYELSELMSQLPIKRGLSKCYQGKSQSFVSLSSVKSLEDLAKKGSLYRKKMKTCASFGGGLDGHKHSPKPTISKKASRGSLLSSLGNYRLPTHVHKNF